MNCYSWLHFTCVSLTVHPLGAVQNGRTPAIIFSLPNNESKLISIEANTATNMVCKSFFIPSCSPTSEAIYCNVQLQVRVHGRMGIAAQRYIVDLGDEQLPVLVRDKHNTASTCQCPLSNSVDTDV